MASITGAISLALTASQYRPWTTANGGSPPPASGGWPLSPPRAGSARRAPPASSPSRSLSPAPPGNRPNSRPPPPHQTPPFTPSPAPYQPPPPRHPRTPPGHSQQDALANPRRAGDQQHVRAACLRQGEQGVDPAELILALKQASLH